MDKARHKRNYDLHSWSGVTLGVFLYIVCFTGTVAVFALHETHVWEDPAKRITYSGEPAPIDNALYKWMTAQSARGKIESLSLRWPQKGHPYYAFSAGVDLHDAEGDSESAGERWHPATLEPIEIRGASMSAWLVRFHIDLKWPAMLGGSEVGRTIVGLAGVLLLLAILTGVVAHTKMKEEAFSMRLDRSARLRWQDSHKVIGLWGAPFHVMIGFTGAVLGIATLFAPVVAVLAFHGDVEAIRTAIQYEPVKAADIEAEMISADAVRAMVHPEAGTKPVRLRIHNYGDENAVYTVTWPTSQEIATYHVKRLSGVTGAELPMSKVEARETVASRINDAVEPLHFGTFGGVALKYLWFGLGLSLSVITALGTMMWIERRQYGNEGARSDRFYNGLSKLNIGVCTGLAVTTAGLFVHNLLYWGDEAGRMASIAWTYFGVWGLAIAYAFLRKGVYKANRELIAITGMLLILAAVLNQFMTEVAAGGIGNHTPTLIIDITLLAFGIASILIARALPKARPVKAKVRRGAKVEAPGAETASGAIPAK